MRNGRNSLEAIQERKLKEIRHNRNCVFLMHVHLVFVTKYRRGVFDSKMLQRLEEIFKELCSKVDAQLVEFNGEHDHVHLLIQYPPKIAISVLVNSLKAVSSRYLQKEFAFEIKKKLWKGVLWSRSYFAGACCGAPLSLIQKYIQSQTRPE
jgi:putative transposase